MKVSAIIPAAGIGARMGAPTPKQFWVVHDRPLIIYTLQTFVESDFIHEIVVPTSKTSVPLLQDLLHRFQLDRKVKVVLGGASRHYSIQNGLSALHKADVVIVHDAVRPFVSSSIFPSLAKAAAEYGAAGTVMPLIDTVLAVTPDGFMKNSLERPLYRASQTPQAFRFDLLKEAYAQASAEEMAHGSECLELARRAGAKVKLLPGSPFFWKITYKPDIYTAERLAMERARQVAMVTGGSRGIGRKIAESLADRGLKVAVVARGKAVRDVAAAIGGLGIQADISRPAEVQHAFAAVLAKWGQVDVLVNNAGIARREKIADLNDSTWREIVDTNLSGAFYCAREALQQMAGSGRGGVIINIGSSAISGGRVGEGAYAASKAGLVALTETIALEGKPYGIHAFTVIPRRTDTALRRALYPDEKDADLLDPADVARVATFCATEWMPHLSGQAFWVK